MPKRSIWATHAHVTDAWDQGMTHDAHTQLNTRFIDQRELLLWTIFRIVRCRATAEDLTHDS
jgi:DNA-directed RNA polymerase specialized sigma24 family protein